MFVARFGFCVVFCLLEEAPLSIHLSTHTGLIALPSAVTQVCLVHHITHNTFSLYLPTLKPTPDASSPTKQSTPYAKRVMLPPPSSRSDAQTVSHVSGSGTVPASSRVAQMGPLGSTSLSGSLGLPEPGVVSGNGDENGGEDEDQGH